MLDDVGRAREHGELVGGFKSVAESLETVVAKLGLQQFGTEGEPFDPTIHEALMHSYAPDVTETTCVAILQPGYRIGERTIRPARVAVAEPQPGRPLRRRRKRRQTTRRAVAPRRSDISSDHRGAHRLPRRPALGPVARPIVRKEGRR